MSHLPLLPILLPLLAGALLLFGVRWGPGTHRALAALATLLTLAVALRLAALSLDGAVRVYLLGDWPAPFGIVLVLDRLAALLLALTAVLAAASLAHAVHGGDRAGPHFHALFQFQLAGLNGAFLAGDLFNLFVFLEVLLIASYGLLLHGGGPRRARAGLHYVVLNLVGSALFLFAVGLVYAAAGTLNLADLARKVPALGAADAPLAATGGLLLLVVFGLKAALPPLHFWLPHAYTAAAAPVAALFAVMTKVGVYAVVRVVAPVFGMEPIAPWLLGAALLGVAVGSMGVVAAGGLREATAYLVMVSVGTLLAGVGLGSVAGLGGALYYLVHTTLVSAGLFLLADLIDHDRPHGTRPAGAGRLGALFLLGAVAAAGMPPLSGLVGKLAILLAAQDSPWAPGIWAVILLSSLLLIVGLSRTGIRLFLEGVPAATPGPGAARLAPAALLLGSSPLLVLCGGPFIELTSAAAAQVLDPGAYAQATLEHRPAAPAIPLETP